MDKKKGKDKNKEMENSSYQWNKGKENEVVDE